MEMDDPRDVLPMDGRSSHRAPGLLLPSSPFRAHDDVSSLDHGVTATHPNRSRLKPIPPPLVFHNDVANLLTEFAIIATSPRSPLMQRNLPIRKRAYSCSSMESGHSYVKQPLTPPPGILSPPPSQASPNFDGSLEEIEPRGETTFGSPFSGPGGCEARSTDVSGSSGTDMEHDGHAETTTMTDGDRAPVPVWHCFLKGTRIRFVEGQHGSSVAAAEPKNWHLAEELRLQAESQRQTDHASPAVQSYADCGLCLLEVTEKSNGGTAISATLHLCLRPVTTNRRDEVAIEVECSIDHPFYIRDGGWSSARPGLTEIRYGIRCRPLRVQDVCLPPSHDVDAFGHHIFESMKSFDFTPEDTSAILALSNMAKHKQEQNLNHLMSLSPPASPTKKCQSNECAAAAANNNNNKPKRPMNAFMLFAKHHRVEYTQMHPGKDNRAISVLLGDTWKRMSTEERNAYAQRAKVLAEEQKKRYPDCWKRRRSLSTSL